MVKRRTSMWWARAAHRGDRGAAAVEFAFILPILAMLILGIVTAGIGYGQAVGVANAVREGSRFAATTVAASTSPPYTVAQWEAWGGTVNSRTRAMLADASAATATICTQIFKNSTAATAVPTAVMLAPKCDVGSQGLSAGASPTPPTVDPNACVVTVWAVRKVPIRAVLVNFDATIHRSSIARYERTC